jgi:hypothetical protein
VRATTFNRFMFSRLPGQRESRSGGVIQLLYLIGCIVNRRRCGCLDHEHCLSKPLAQTCPSFPPLHSSFCCCGCEVDVLELCN